MVTNKTTLQAFRSNAKKDVDRDYEEVWTTVKSWNKEFLNNNPDAYFQYIHDQLSLFVASCPYRINGKQDDRDEFEWCLKQGKTKVNFFQEIDPLIQFYGNSSIVTYYTRANYGEGAADPMVF